MLRESINFLIDGVGVQTFNHAELNSLKARPGIVAWGCIRPAVIVLYATSHMSYVSLLISGRLEQLFETYYVFHSVKPRLVCEIDVQQPVAC